MARNEFSERGSADSEEGVPSDTLLAEGTHAPTLDGATDSPATMTHPASDIAYLVQALPVVEREHYAVGAPFATGGIGQISAAMDRRLGRRVAIKELRRNTRYTRLRFSREIKITAKLQHPNIVPLHEAGQWPNGEPFFAMKLVDGDSLEGAIESCVTLQDHLRLIRHVTDVAEAMAHAHSRRIVHRDLKPGNVLVGPFGETVVIDWGLAKDLAEEDDDEDEQDVIETASETVPDRYQTNDGVVLGTPSYMPPEQAAGRPVDERADVYALGALMYQALSGRMPYFEYHPRRVLERVIAAAPTPLAQLQPELPKDLLAIVDKAMAREPKDRYRTAANMADELNRFTNGRLVAAYDYSLAELVRRFMDRHRAALGTALVGLLVLLGLGAWSFRRIARERDAAEIAQAAEMQARELETRARADAERRLDEAVLSAARSDLERDPTRALARLKRLRHMIPGASTVAADAVERGVALRVLRGHTDRIDAVAYSGSGNYVASSGVDGIIRLERRDTRETRLLERHGARVPSIAFAGELLVSADYEGTVVVWDATTGAAVREILGHANKEIRAVAVDAAGERVATVAEDGIRIHALASGEHLATFEVAVERAAFAEFVPGAQRLLTGSHSGVMHVWDLAGTDHLQLEGHVGPVHGAAVSPNGRRVVSAGEDGSVRKWELATGEGTIIGHHERGARVVRFLDNTRAVSGGMDGKVIVWDLERATSRTIAHHEERVTALTTLGGRFIASAGWDKRTVLVDDVSHAKHILRGHDSVISALAFAPDGKQLASASWDRTVRLWPTESSDRRVFAHDVGVKAVAFDAAGQRIVSGGHDNAVRVWNAHSGKLLQELNGHTDHVFRVLFSPDGRQVASSSDDRTVRLWRVADGTHEVFEGHSADVEELAFSADGRWLASAGEDARIGLWPVVAGGSAEGKFLLGHDRAITAVAFMPDDQTLVSASLDGVVAIWGVPGGEMQLSQKLHVGGATSLAVSERGLIASVGRDARVILWRPGAAPQVVAERAGVDRVTLSKDGSLVAFSAVTGYVGLCRLGGDAPVCSGLVGHEEHVAAMHFTDDNAQLVTGSEDGTVRIWSTTTFESRPVRMHPAPIFDITVHADRIASACGDGTMGLMRLVAPTPPEGLRARLSQLTELVLPPTIDDSAATAPASGGP